MRTKGTVNKDRIGNEIEKICQECEKPYKTLSKQKKYCEDCTKLRQRMAGWSYGNHRIELRNFLKKEEPTKSESIS